MYDPLHPNRYREVKKACYLNLLKNAPKQGGEGGNFLSAALLSTAAAPLTASSSSSSTSHLSAPVPSMTLLRPPPSLVAGPSSSSPPPPALLHMSAEELHAQRVQRSAAMGVQRAVEYQKDSIESEFKRRKMEGSDARSRVTNLLAKMRGTPPSTTSTTQPEASSAAGLSHSVTAPSPSAPLAFLPSGLGTGGFKLTAVGPSVAQSAATGLAGVPGPTLLMRSRQHPSLWDSLHDNQQAALLLPPGPSSVPSVLLARQAAEQVWAVLLRDILRECSAFGVVTSCIPHVLQVAELDALSQRWRADFPAASSPQHDEAMNAERVRIFVRFDAVAEAFRAAEAMAPLGDQWSVVFYPTTAFDQGELGVTDVWCRPLRS